MNKLLSIIQTKKMKYFGKKNSTIIYLIFVLMLITQLWIGYMFFKKWSNDRYTFVGNACTLLTNNFN